MIPSLESTLKLIDSYRENEKKLATKRGTLHVHLQKWDGLTDGTH